MAYESFKHMKHDEDCPACRISNITRDCLGYCDKCKSMVDSIDYLHHVEGMRLCEKCVDRLDELRLTVHLEGQLSSLVSRLEALEKRMEYHANDNPRIGPCSEPIDDYIRPEIEIDEETKRKIREWAEKQK